MGTREETVKASLGAQAPRLRRSEQSDMGAVRDPEAPHGGYVPDDSRRRYAPSEPSDLCRP